MAVKLVGQSEWGWKIAIYLFLAGMGAGAYAVGSVLGLLGFNEAGKIGIFLGFPSVFIGTLFLIADLGVKMRALRAFMNPSTSWIAKGTYIISIFMILGAIHIALCFQQFRFLAGSDGFRIILSTVNFIFAILTIIYTGVLLGESKSIAIWSTPALPFLFLTSGLSTGTMAIILFLSNYKPLDINIFHALLRLDILFIVLELIVIIFYLWAMHRTVESRASAALMMRGKYRSHFWGGVVLLGLLLPLLIDLLEINFDLSSSLIFVYSLLSCIPALFGGFLLRYVILKCGVKAPFRVGVVEYTVPGLAHT